MLIGVTTNRHQNISSSEHFVCKGCGFLPGDINASVSHDCNGEGVLAVRLDAG